MNGSAPGARPRRALAAAAVGLLLLHLVLGFVLRVPAIGAGPDDAEYLLLGRGLFDLQYRSSWLVGAPPATRYPPVYPVLLAAAGATAPGGFPKGVALNLLLSAAALAAFTALAWRWSPIAAVGALAVAALNPSLLSLAGQVASEPGFMLFLYLTLWFAAAKPERWYLALLTALAAAFTRSIGVAVVAGLLVHWLLQRRWRPAAFLALLGGLTLGGWFLRAALEPDQFAGQSYLADARTIIQPGTADGPTAAPEGGGGALLAIARSLAVRVAANAGHYATRDLPTILAIPTVPDTVADNALWLVVLLGFGGVGVAVLGRRNSGWLAVAGCYGAILAVWPYVLGRFVAPLVPLVALVVIEGSRVTLGRVNRRAGVTAAIALATVLSIAAFAKDRRLLAGKAGCDRARPYDTPACFERVEFAFLQTVFDAARVTPVDAVLLTPKAPAVYYLIGRRTLEERLAASLRAPALHDYLAEHGARDLLLSQIHSDQATIAAALLPRCDEWEVVSSRGNGSALLLRRQGPGAVPSACGPLARTEFTRPPPDP